MKKILLFVFLVLISFKLKSQVYNQGAPFMEESVSYVDGILLRKVKKDSLEEVFYNYVSATYQKKVTLFHAVNYKETLFYLLKATGRIPESIQKMEMFSVIHEF